MFIKFVVVMLHCLLQRRQKVVRPMNNKLHIHVPTGWVREGGTPSAQQGGAVSSPIGVWGEVPEATVFNALYKCKS